MKIYFDDKLMSESRELMVLAAMADETEFTVHEIQEVYDYMTGGGGE